MLQTARHRCNISSKVAVLPRRYDAEIGPANSLHASAYKERLQYNERFDLKNCNSIPYNGSGGAKKQ